MATQQEVIKKFMYSLDKTSKKGEATLDEAIKYATDGKYSTLKASFKQMIADCDSAKSADDFLKTYCGINLDNTDTGAITGLDAGGSKIKTADSIVPEEGSLVEFESGNWFDNIEGQDGLTIQLAKRTGSLSNLDNIAKRSFDDLSEQEVYLWRSIYTWWIRNGLDLIAESYGDNFSFDKEKSSATNKDRKIYIIFEAFGEDEPLAETWGGPGDAQKSTNNLVIRINLSYYNDATGKNGAVSTEEHLDRTIAHELTHAVMRANIDYYNYMPALIKEGVAELTHGIDDTRTNGIKKLAGNSSLLSQALSMETDADDVKVEGVKSPAYAGGYMFLRYLARQMGDLTITNTTAKKTIQTFNGSDSILSNGANNVTINSGAGNDTIKAYGKNISVNGGSGNDFASLYSDAYNVTVLTSSGNDTVASASKTASIVTGSGNDSVLIYTNAENHTLSAGSGNDKIYSGAQTASINAGAGNDYIHLYSQGTKHTVKAGTGNDSIRSYATDGVLYQISSGDGDDTITGLSSADTISVSGSKYYTKEIISSSVKMSLVSGGSILFNDVGDKKINVKGSTLLNVVDNTKNSTKITAAKGEDSIKNSGDKVTIVGASDVDSVWNYGDSVSINGSNGNDLLKNWGDKVTLLGGKGNDTLRNDTSKGGASKVKLNGNAGDDELKNFGNKVTVLGGSGNDSLYNYKNGGGGENVSIDGGTDNDVIVNYGIKSTLSGGDGDDTISNYAKGYVSGELVFEDGGQSVKIYGGAGNDSIKNYGDKVTIDGGDGADYIANYGGAASMFGGEDNDTLWGDAGADTILGGEGNDKLYGDAGNDKLYGGDGKDYLKGGAGKDSLWGGAGNDTLWGGSGKDTFIYTANEGTDRIMDYEVGDILKILKTDGSNGSFKSSKYSGGDLTLTINGGGKVIFDDVSASDTFNINSTTYKISGSKLVK